MASKSSKSMTWNFTGKVSPITTRWDKLITWLVIWVAPRASNCFFSFDGMLREDCFDLEHCWLHTLPAIVTLPPQLKQGPCDPFPPSCLMSEVCLILGRRRAPGHPHRLVAPNLGAWHGVEDGAVPCELLFENYHLRLAKPPSYVFRFESIHPKLWHDGFAHQMIETRKSCA